MRYGVRSCSASGRALRLSEGVTMSNTFNAHTQPEDAVSVGLKHVEAGSASYYVLSLDLGYHTDVRVFLTPEQAEALRDAFGHIATGATAGGHVGAYSV